MKVSAKQYSNVVNLAVTAAIADLGDHEINSDTFIYGVTRTPQFEMAFKGDKQLFKDNIKTIVDTFKAQKSDDNTPGHICVSIDFFEDVLQEANAIHLIRKDKKVCLADILLAMRGSTSNNLEDYLEIADENIDDFIDYMYIAENKSYSVAEYDELQIMRGNPDYEFELVGPYRLDDNFNWKDYCRDMLEEEKNTNKILVGREKELDETIRILCRKEKANPVHVGEAGVGKTEITLGLARKINNNDVPEKIKGAKLYSLDISGIMANTGYRGELESKVKGIFEELERQSKETVVLLYIDEIHMICGAGRTEGSSMDIANMLKPLLTRSNIKVIGATTYEEYKQYIEKDKALARRFKIVKVEEPTPEEAKEIIRGIIPVYEKFHHVKYTDDVADTVVDLTVKYVHDKKLPDKAIDIIDEAGANVSKNYKSGSRRKVINKKSIENIIALSYNIPVNALEKDEISKLKTLDTVVKENIFGQDTAVDECVNAIKLSRLGLLEGNKPIANLLFVGQTGVGKTEVALQLAKAMDMELVRFDMSEYSDDMSVNKLIGASAGYVGYEDGGLLVEEIRKHPYSVLLLDEIEKASPKVFNTLLQVMDNATLTDNKGRKADFKNVIIIMTSNAGASGIVKNGLGFGTSEKEVDFSNMDKEVKNIFTPEFRNRLTKIIKFNSMSDDMANKIIKKHLDSFIKIVELKGIKVKYTKDVIDYIKKKGVTPEFGAREILRVIDSDVKMLFIDVMLNKSSDNVNLTVKNNKIVIE